ncbi:hypothetical protein M0R01_03830 [bacterium]|nr:hypothetical protein [bacterium]
MVAKVKLTVGNERDCQAINIHKAFPINLELDDSGSGTAQGGSGFSFIVGYSCTGVASDDADIIMTTHGTATNGTVTGIQIPTDIGKLDVGIVVDQRSNLTGLLDDIVYTLTPSDDGTAGTAATVAMSACDSFDYSYSYNKNDLFYGPGVLYVDGRVIGLLEEDIAFSHLEDVTDIMSGSLKGKLESIINKEGWSVKCSIKQQTLDRLKWIWNLKNAPTSNGTINILGSAYAGESIDLESSSGLLDEHHVMLKIPINKADNALVVELYSATCKGAGDWAIGKDKNVATTVTFDANVIADPDNQIFGKLYVIDIGA